MQEHYLNVVDSVANLKRTIQKSSLNRLEFNNIRSTLHEINEQTLPHTLTWVPKDSEHVGADELFTEQEEEIKRHNWLNRLKLR